MTIGKVIGWAAYCAIYSIATVALAGPVAGFSIAALLAVPSVALTARVADWHVENVRRANGGRAPDVEYASLTTGEMVTIDGETGEEVSRRPMEPVQQRNARA